MGGWRQAPKLHQLYSNKESPVWNVMMACQILIVCFDLRFSEAVETLGRSRWQGRLFRGFNIRPGLRTRLIRRLLKLWNSWRHAQWLGSLVQSRAERVELRKPQISCTQRRSLWSLNRLVLDRVQILDSLLLHFRRTGLILVNAEHAAALDSALRTLLPTH